MNWLVVLVIALVVVLAVYWKTFVKNFWKILYTVLAVAAFVALIKLGWFCAERAFSPRTAELQIVASGNFDAAKVVGFDSYKATYELFNSHFSQLLVILGFLGTMFGVLIPAGAYLLQRQSLKDERERMEKDFKAREDSIIEKATAAAREAKDKAEESVRLAEDAKSKLELEMKGNYINLSEILGCMGMMIYDLNSNNNKDNKDKCYARMIVIFTCSIIFAAKGKDKNQCMIVLDHWNDLSTAFSEKITEPRSDPDDIIIIKDCLGDDFYKFKEIYNKYFETPID